MKPKVFFDSDVIISSLLSEKGVSYLLINTSNVEFFISNYSRAEIENVLPRLKIAKKKFETQAYKKLKVITLKDELKAIKDKYKPYVYDIYDAHIVAGVVYSKSGFLLSYNLKDFKREKIKRDFNILVYPPALFLQYLRTLSKSN